MKKHLETLLTEFQRDFHAACEAEDKATTKRERNRATNKARINGECMAGLSCLVQERN